MEQAVLTGFIADEVNPFLRFSDGITLIPDDVNGVAVYSG